jgi:hypothetical protein
MWPPWAGGQIPASLPARRVLPIDKTGRWLSGLIGNVRLVVTEGGPYAIPGPRRPGQHGLLGFLAS